MPDDRRLDGIERKRLAMSYVARMRWLAKLNATHTAAEVWRGFAGDTPAENETEPTTARKPTKDGDQEIEVVRPFDQMLGMIPGAKPVSPKQARAWAEQKQRDLEQHVSIIG